MAPCSFIMKKAGKAVSVILWYLLCLIMYRNILKSPVHPYSKGLIAFFNHFGKFRFACLAMGKKMWKTSLVTWHMTFQRILADYLKLNHIYELYSRILQRDQCKGMVLLRGKIQLGTLVDFGGYVIRHRVCLFVQHNVLTHINVITRQCNFD